MLGGIAHKLIEENPCKQNNKLRTVESEIAKSFQMFKIKINVDIGSYPFFRAGRLGVA